MIATVNKMNIFVLAYRTLYGLHNTSCFIQYDEHQ